VLKPPIDGVDHLPLEHYVAETLDVILRPDIAWPTVTPVASRTQKFVEISRMNEKRLKDGELGCRFFLSQSLCTRMAVAAAMSYSYLMVLIDLDGSKRGAWSLALVTAQP